MLNDIKSNGRELGNIRTIVKKIHKAREKAKVETSSKIILVSATIPNESSNDRRDQSILRGFKSIVDSDYDSVRLTTTKDVAGNHIKKFKIKCGDFKDKMQFLVDLYGIHAVSTIKIWTMKPLPLTEISIVHSKVVS